MSLSLKREAPHEMFTGRTVRTSREIYGGLPALNVNTEDFEIVFA